MNRGDVTFHAAPWSRWQVGVTIGVIALLIGETIAAFVLRMPPSAKIILGVLAPIAIPVGMAFRVQGYLVTPESVEVLRWGWRVRFWLRGLESVEVGRELVSGCLRSMGNGGFFVTSGWFWNRRLGSFRMLTNDPKLAVVLRYADRRVVLGPANPELFAAELRRRAGLAPG